ncbi:unnamed protein product [Mesocestoides corti]|uniref:MATH domain-containing protein n=1 Tax=Mesocestoides corti TaxID=53468 RepID=A0A0R3U4E0_MESCO|nr:unnamed protein product [Mesocestoides corti]
MSKYTGAEQEVEVTIQQPDLPGSALTYKKLLEQQDEIQKDLEKLANLINMSKRRSSRPFSLNSFPAQLFRVDDSEENSILSLSFPLEQQSGKGRWLIRNNNAQLKHMKPALFGNLDCLANQALKFECGKQMENNNTTPTAKYIRIQADSTTGEPMISIFDECGQSQVACAYLTKDFKLDIDFKLWDRNGSIVPMTTSAESRRSSGGCYCPPSLSNRASSSKPCLSPSCPKLNPSQYSNQRYSRQVSPPHGVTICPNPHAAPIPKPNPSMSLKSSPQPPPPPPANISSSPPNSTPGPTMQSGYSRPPPGPIPNPLSEVPEPKLTGFNNWHIWRISNFAELEECNGGEWCEPFYLGQPGYRMQAKLEFTTYLFGIYIKLVSGDYDDCLTWPFDSDIYFSILDQTGAGNHIVRVLRPYLNDEDEKEVWQRPTAENSDQIGWGLPDIGLRSLIHSKIYKPSPYMRNGTLYIQITLGKAICPQEAV